MRILLRADALAMLLFVPTGLMEVWEQSHLPPGYDPAEDLLGSEALSGCIASVWLPIGLSLHILFLRWIYKTNQFLHRFSAEAPEVTPGWSIGWYFVPIANLFKPYRSMKEMWRLSHRGDAVDEDLLSVWWCLWIVSSILGQLVLRFTIRDNPDERHWLLWVDLLDSAIALALALVALRLVQRLGAAIQRNFGAAPPASAAFANDAPAPPFGSIG